MINSLIEATPMEVLLHNASEGLPPGISEDGIVPMVAHAAGGFAGGVHAHAGWELDQHIDRNGVSLRQHAAANTGNSVGINGAMTAITGQGDKLCEVYTEVLPGTKVVDFGGMARVRGRQLLFLDVIGDLMREGPYRIDTDKLLRSPVKFAGAVLDLVNSTPFTVGTHERADIVLGVDDDDKVVDLSLASCTVPHVAGPPRKFAGKICGDGGLGESDLGLPIHLRATHLVALMNEPLGNIRKGFEPDWRKRLTRRFVVSWLQDAKDENLAGNEDFNEIDVEARYLRFLEETDRLMEEALDTGKIGAVKVQFVAPEPQEGLPGLFSNTLDSALIGGGAGKAAARKAIANPRELPSTEILVPSEKQRRTLQNIASDLGLHAYMLAGTHPLRKLAPRVSTRSAFRNA